MTIFTPTRDPAATKILSEELEKKIDEVNKHLVDTRALTEKLQEKKNQLEIDVRNLETKKGTLLGEVSELKKEVDRLTNEVSKLEDRYSNLQATKVVLEKSIDDLSKLNTEEAGKLNIEKEELKKRKVDLDAQEATLRIYGKGLEEKEKKLDIYAERVKKLLDSVKPE